MKRAVSIFLVVFGVVVIDQVTKYLIMKNLPMYDSIKIFSFLQIVHVKNTGAAFGMFKTLGSTFFIALSVTAIIFIGFLLVKKAYHSFGLALILGGAIGNLIDRVLFGQVVDFIDFSLGSYHWPAFNVADSSLTIGVGFIVLTQLLKK